jgi:aminoglycoside phosphotransferase (APT) family kinase protein
VKREHDKEGCRRGSVPGRAVEGGGGRAPAARLGLPTSRHRESDAAQLARLPQVARVSSCERDARPLARDRDDTVPRLGFLGDSTLREYRPVLRHGDPWYGNWLVDDHGRLTALIDWEDAAIGDPAIDFCDQLYLGHAFTQKVIEAYRESGGQVTDDDQHRMCRWSEVREFQGIDLVAAPRRRGGARGVNREAAPKPRAGGLVAQGDGPALPRLHSLYFHTWGCPECYALTWRA